jgi:hypothetical protein
LNNIKLLKAQANLALSMVDKRARIGIDNYIAALEAEVAENAAQQSVQLTVGTIPVFSIIHASKLYRSLWLVLAHRN